MKALPKILLALTGVAALSLAYPASLQAVPTTYRYTGNPFSDVFGVYTTSDFVTVMVTLAGPLGANMPLTDVTTQVTAFTLSDGVQTLRITTPQVFSDFQFATNATGDIVLWQVSVAVSTDSREIQSFNNGIDPTADLGVLTFHTDFGFNFGPAGAWTQGTPTPDAGSTLPLMTLTLLALGVVARQFKRGAA